MLDPYNCFPPHEMTPMDFEVTWEGVEFLAVAMSLHWD
jgi:hypothetical protein